MTKGPQTINSSEQLLQLLARAVPHPVAALFPMLPEEELAELASDIAANGQRDPIVLYAAGELLLDGRNRLAACKLAGREPLLELWQGEEHEIVPWILSKNLHRRHLTPSQRAMVAAGLTGLQQGQRQTGKLAGLMTQAQAAEALGVSERSVRSAAAVLASGDEQLAEAVRSGEVSASAAAASLRPNPAADAELIVVALQKVYHQTDVMPGDLVSADLVWDAWLGLLGLEASADNIDWLHTRWDAALTSGEGRGIFLSHREQMALPGARPAPSTSTSSGLDADVVAAEQVLIRLYQAGPFHGKRAPLRVFRAQLEKELGIKGDMPQERWEAVLHEGHRRAVWTVGEKYAWLDPVRFKAATATETEGTPQPESSALNAPTRAFLEEPLEVAGEPDESEARAVGDAPALLRAVENVETQRSANPGEALPAALVRAELAWVLREDQVSNEWWALLVSRAVEAGTLGAAGDLLWRVVEGKRSKTSKPPVPAMPPEGDLEEDESSEEEDGEGDEEERAPNFADLVFELRKLLAQHQRVSLEEARSHVDETGGWGRPMPDSLWEKVVSVGVREGFWTSDGQHLEVLAQSKAEKRAQSKAAQAEVEAAIKAGRGDRSLIDLRCCDVSELLASLPDGSAALVIADPPWKYSNNQNGAAAKRYPCLPMEEIEAHIEAAYRIGAPDSYLAVWYTFPMAQAWLRRDLSWRYLTGGAWAKPGLPGTGYHWRGNAEPVAIYGKGKPRPVTTDILLSCHVTERKSDGSPGNSRVAHSAKPDAWMAGWIRTWVPEGGLVLDMYAGTAAAAHAVLLAGGGRRYIGAELHEGRHAEALAGIEALCAGGAP